MSERLGDSHFRQTLHEFQAIREWQPTLIRLGSQIFAQAFLGKNQKISEIDARSRNDQTPRLHALLVLRWGVINLIRVENVDKID
jgi:hypothetical protein